MSDYLFDKDGEPDPEVAQLEQLLAPLAYRGAPLRLPPERARRIAFSIGVLAAAAAIAATLVLVIAQPWRTTPDEEPPAIATPARPGWPATVHGSAATADGRPLTGETRLSVGAWLDTGDSRVQLRVADLGTVELAPGTRARIVESGAALHKLALAVGTLSARIDAPARQFIVETARVTAIDLGCAFTLSVDAAGRGRLSVSAGAVALSAGGAPEVVVPAGAECELTERGPGTPVLSDARESFRAALARYTGDTPTLRTLLREARPQDRLTLRQLLSTAGPGERALLQERLRELEPGGKPTPRPTPHGEAALKPAAQTPPPSAAPPVSAPAPTTMPVRKPQPMPASAPSKLSHDPFKDLDRSAP